MIDEVVIGATGKPFIWTAVDEDGVAKTITGGTVRLQGQSTDLPTVDIDVAGSLTGTNEATWTQLGGSSYVSAADLTAAGLTQATYWLRVKYTGSDTLVDYGKAFAITWVMPPV